MTDKILAFPGAEPLPENPITVAPRPWSHCGHDSIQLDEHQRTVVCAQCAAVLDPFDFLRHNAQTLQRAWSNHRSVVHRVNEMQERVEALDKERKRLAAQVKRLQEKVPSIDVRGKGVL